MPYRAALTILRAAALAALLAGPASAQVPNVNLMPELKSKTPEEKERDEKLDRAYRDSLRKIPDAKGTNDPWGGVRSTDAPAPAAAKKAAPAKRSGAVAPAN